MGRGSGVTMAFELCSVGYTWRAYPPALAFAQAHQHGYRGVELRDYLGCVWGPLDDALRTLDALVVQARAAGLTPSACFRVVELPDADAGASASAALADAARMASALQRLGIPIWHTRLHVPGVGDSRAATEQLYADAGRHLSRIGEIAAAAGVTIAVESHMGTIHDTVGAQRALLDACPSRAVTASLDFANLLIADAATDLHAAIRGFAGRIGYVHLKNAVRRAAGWDWNVPVRAGDIDYRRLLPDLAAVYAGPLGVEYCGPGDPAWVSRDDADYLREVLADLAATAR